MLKSLKHLKLCPLQYPIEVGIRDIEGPLEARVVAHKRALGNHLVHDLIPEKQPLDTAATFRTVSREI